MRIETTIDYWGEGVATFDPEKVLIELTHWFPEAVIDPTDYSQAEVERITQFAEGNLPEPRRLVMIEQILGKNKRNGPVYQFSIELNAGKKITGYAKRYTVAFISEGEIDSATRQRIVDFLESLNLGEIISE